MYACNGVLFNHESPRRGETFVTRKITMATAAIALGKQERLYLGNLNALRDWGHAKDYVEAMWRILQQDVAEDYVIATGVTTSFRDFERIDRELFEQKVGDNSEQRISELIGKTVVCIDPKYYRPTEVDLLIGDPTKSKTKLGWVPEYDLAGLVKDMVSSDLKIVKKESYNSQWEHIVG